MKDLDIFKDSIDLAKTLSKIFQDRISEFEIDYVSDGIFEAYPGFELLINAEHDDIEFVEKIVSKVAKEQSEMIKASIKEAVQEKNIIVEFDSEELYFVEMCENESEWIEIHLPFSIYKKGGKQ